MTHSNMLQVEVIGQILSLTISQEIKHAIFIEFFTVLGNEYQKSQ